MDVAANISVVNNGDGTFTVSSALDGTDTLSNIENFVDSAGEVIDLPSFISANSASEPDGSSTISQNPFSSVEVAFDFIPEPENNLDELDAGFNHLEDFDFGFYDDIGDVFEIA